MDLNGGGALRVLTEPVTAGRRPIGSFRVAESLGQVGFAQGSPRHPLDRRRDRIGGPGRRDAVDRSADRAATRRIADSRPRSTPKISTSDLNRRRTEGGPDPRRLVQPDARPSAGGVRARTRIRRRCVPRVADPGDDRPRRARSPRRDASGASASGSTWCAATAAMERLITEMLSLAAEESGEALRREPVESPTCSPIFAGMRRCWAHAASRSPISTEPWMPISTASLKSFATCCGTRWPIRRPEARSGSSGAPRRSGPLHGHRLGPRVPVR